MASVWDGISNGLNWFMKGYEIYNSYKSNKTSEDYYNSQIETTANSLEISKANLELQYEQLRNNYVTTLNDLKSNRLSTLQSRDDYAANMENTQLTIEKLMKGENGIEYFDALLARWQDNYDYQVATTRKEGKANYDSLMANYTGTEVMNAEAGRGGKTAELLEQQQKQNVEAYVGKDMKLDAIGGIYSQTLTELNRDLNSDKHTYMTQLGILGKSLVAEKESLKDYKTNLAEIDEEIAKYDAQIQTYEDYLNGKEFNAEDIAKAYGSTKPGESDTPTESNPTETSTPETTNPIEDVNTSVQDMDSILNGDTSNNHAGTTTQDWSSYALKNNDITNNLKFIKNNPDRVTTEILDASSLGDGWQGMKVTDDAGNVVVIYKDSEGRFIQEGTDKDGNKTYKLTTADGDGWTYKAEDIEEAIGKLDTLDTVGDVAHGVVSLAGGLLGPVGAVVGLVDLIYQGVTYLNEKGKSSTFDSLYKSASEKAAEEIAKQYSENWYKEQTAEELRAAAQEAGNPYYVYNGQRYDTATGELHTETTAIQGGVDSGKYKYDENGYVVSADSSSTPEARTTGGGTDGSYSSLEERVAAEEAQVNKTPEERAQETLENRSTANKVAEMLISRTAVETTPLEPQEEVGPDEEEIRPKVGPNVPEEVVDEVVEEPVEETAKATEKPPVVKNQTNIPETTTVTKEEDEARAKAEAEAREREAEEQRLAEEAERTKQAAIAQKQAEEKAKAEAELKAKQEAEAEEAERVKAEEQRQAEELARAKAEAQSKKQAEARAKAEAQAKAKAAAEEKAKKEAEEKAKAEAEAKAKEEAEAKKKAEEAAKLKRQIKYNKTVASITGQSTQSKLTAYFTNKTAITTKSNATQTQTTTPISKTTYSPAIQAGLDSGKYIVDKYGYVVANPAAKTTTTKKTTSTTKTAISSKKSYSAMQ